MVLLYIWYHLKIDSKGFICCITSIEPLHIINLFIANI